MYQVDLNVDPASLLDWDKTLPAQSPKVLKALLGDELADKIVKYGTDTSLTVAERQQLSSDIAQSAPIPRGIEWFNVKGKDLYYHMERAAEMFTNKGHAYQIGGKGNWFAVTNDGVPSPVGYYTKAEAEAWISSVTPDPNPATASELLKRAGVPGIRYADAFSRGGGKPKPTSNYVIFDDGVVSILRKYGIMLPLAGGAAAAQSHQPSPGLDQFTP